ncbi:hypothetical protein FRC04_000509 [Tulasnella sp. 424]|nr:hypothetical protein FRC04_000509 [Tulasnella sp. 424]
MQKVIALLATVLAATSVQAQSGAYGQCGGNYDDENDHNHDDKPDNLSEYIHWNHDDNKDLNHFHRNEYYERSGWYWGRDPHSGTAVIGPESSGGLFTINGSIKLNGPNLYLNIANSTTSYHALTFDSTATFTGWALEGDTIITAQSSQYGRQLNFLACPTSKTSEWQLYLQLGSDTPSSSCANYVSIHLPLKDYNDTSPTVSRNAGLTSLNVVIDPVEIVTVAEREFAESVVAVSVHMRNLPERWWGLLESTKLPLRMFVPSLDNRGFFQPCMLGDLTTLEELEIGDTYAYPVLLYLAAPINSEMPCPQLRKLTLIVDVRWGLGELVAKLLRARKISCRELTVYDGDDQVVKLESGSFRSQ